MIQHTLTVPDNLTNERFDAALAVLLPEHSRARLQGWIKSGEVTLNGQVVKPKEKVFTGNTIMVNAIMPSQVSFDAENIALDILHADDDVIILNKPAGLVVHPAAGHHDGTMLNALLHHFPELENIPRAGIIHRLDKDTSGILMIARSLTAHTALVEALQARTIKREYFALVQGMIISGSTIETFMDRHAHQRTKMAVTENGKLAITHYRIGERFPHHTLLRVNLETGRTHQIRVHMAHIKHPIVGDPVYGRLILPKGASETERTALQTFKRQALHAHQLGFEHPTTGEWCEFQAPMPEDMTALLKALKS